MTEQGTKHIPDKVIPEVKFIDKIIIRTGDTENGNWTLHSLPEYIEKDEKLSIKLMNKFSSFFKSKGFEDATIKLTNGCNDEKLREEYFWLEMIFGKGSNNEKFTISRDYLAEIDHEKVEGRVRLTLGLPSGSEETHFDIEEELLSVCIKNMEKNHPNRQNEWSDNYFVKV